LGIQEFQLTVHKENAIMGGFGLYICSTMKILRERIVVHILKSVVSTATAIRNLDSKQKNVILERFWGHNFLTIRII
jgi:heme exporter protein D